MWYTSLWIFLSTDNLNRLYFLILLYLWYLLWQKTIAMLNKNDQMYSILTFQHDEYLQVQLKVNSGAQSFSWNKKMKNILRFLNIVGTFLLISFYKKSYIIALMLNYEHCFHFLYFNLHYVIRSKWKSL